MEKPEQPGGKKETEQGIDREYLQATQNLINLRKEGVQTGIQTVSEGLYLDGLLKTAHKLAFGNKVPDEEVGLLLAELGFLAARNYEEPTPGMDPKMVVNDNEVGKQALRQFFQTYEKMLEGEGEFRLLSSALARARLRMGSGGSHFFFFC